MASLAEANPITTRIRDHASKMATYHRNHNQQKPAHFQLSNWRFVFIPFHSQIEPEETCEYFTTQTKRNKKQRKHKHNYENKRTNKTNRTRKMEHCSICSTNDISEYCHCSVPILNTIPSGRNFYFFLENKPTTLQLLLLLL